VAMVWAVDRLGRSLADLIGSMQELHGAKVDLFIHQQGLDTTTASGRAMFGMLGVFSEFERAMIQARVKAGLERAKQEQMAGKVRRDAHGRRLKAIGRPKGIQRHGSGHQGASGGRRWHVDDRGTARCRQRYSAAGEAGTGRVAIIGQPYCPMPSERLDTIIPPVLANLAWYSNPSTDAAIEEGLVTINPLKRAAASGKAQAQVWKDLPCIFLGVDRNLAAHSKKLHGRIMRPDQQST
jgi:hypothetical protein